MKQGRQIVYGIILLLVLTAQPGAVAQNFSYKTLFMFGDPDLSTGVNPSGSLALGKDGRLYGTATCFSAFGTNYATVFGVNRDGTGFKMLHHFGDIAGDGSSPASGVIEGSDRALYGTTSGGGSLRYGTVFKVNKDGSGYQILWNFQGYANGDGANPQAGLIEASDGVLYGTTYLGGAGDGTVFRLNKDGTGYSIIKSLVRGGAEGAGPFGLIEGTDGALYGMSYSAGSGHGGTIFKLNKDGTGFSVLWNFQQGSTNGFWTSAPLMEGSDGVLYGATTAGGLFTNPGSGTVFRINRDGTGLGVLHRFDVSEGDQYDHGLLEGNDGALYGTRSYGGSAAGTLYKLNKDGSGFVVVHNFTGTNDDGLLPFAGLTKGTNGEFYGSTALGGKRGPSGDPSESYGTIFVLRRAVSILGVSVQSNGHARLLFVGQGGKSYDIQATDTLVGAQWTKVGTATAGTDGRFQFDDDSAPSHLTRFYRTAEQ
ncbi:MAG: hypothetical protein DME22_23615 [Verrucomicrobia bacterium]|nr:MAG: hypothetical protein DME22_23615 [Verrucomicrobiota bacterium]